MLLTLVLLFSLTSSEQVDVDWRTTVLPPIEHSQYRLLHECVSCEEDVTACFKNATKASPTLGILAKMGLPPLLLIPDCLESVLQSSTDSTLYFAATSEKIPADAILAHFPIAHSVLGVEAAHPPRRIPGGPYTKLVKALKSVGYVDGESMRAVAWDWRLPVDEVLKRIIALLDTPEVLVIARGAGCALAARAATNRKISGLICLSEPTDDIMPAGLHANELGLVTRRRGRPIPIIGGPWGDGSGPLRCEMHKGIEAVNVGQHTALCADNCRRWITGARQEECEFEGEMTTELQCLLRALSG